MNIAIVGNKHIAHDCSARIDVADMVVRISKMDHLDSGLVGTRTDALYLEPNCVWWGYPPERRRLDMLNTIPSIYIRNSWWRRTGEKLISQGILRWDQVHVIPPEVENGLKDCTTFAMAVYDVHRRLPGSGYFHARASTSDRNGTAFSLTTPIVGKVPIWTALSSEECFSLFNFNN